MKLLKNALLAVVIAMTTISLAPMLPAQNVDSAMLLHPAADSWPGYHGDYSGRRHSNLTQITPQNVRELALSWLYQTGQTNALKCTPLLVDGVLYITVPDNVWAVDARS